MTQSLDCLLSARSSHDAAMVAELNRREPTQHPLPTGEPRCYRAGVPIRLLHEQHDLIDQIVHFAFDTLGAQQLELRVRDGE